jgi:hypothetical protein
MDKNKDIFEYVNNVSIPTILIGIFVLIVVYIILKSLGGGAKNMDDDFRILGYSSAASGNSSWLFSGVGILLFGVAILLILQYVMKYKIFENVNDIFTETTSEIQKIDIPTVDTISVPKITAPKIKNDTNQVFNVPGNNYGYDDAKAVCSAYGARLAKYSEVEKAYNKGGEWCNYGWSDGQMALFPTQQNTYDVLQTKKGHENDCGRPGINGGYMANPELKFGVNCYGKKPKIKPEEADLMRDTTPYPITMEEIELQNKVDYWKDKVSDILVAPFNYKNWSA